MSYVAKQSAKESPSNPRMRITDLRALAKLAPGSLAMATDADAVLGWVRVSSVMGRAPRSAGAQA